MTDFGSRKQIGDASAANQALEIAAIEAVEAATGNANAANQALEIAAIEAVETAVLVQTAQGTFTPINAQVFDDGLSTYTSAEMDVSSYRDFLLRIILAVTLAPTDITIDVLISYDGTTYEKYMTGPFGSLMYEDTGGAKTEALSGKIIAPKMKIRATATGVDASNKFTLTCKVAASR